MYLQFVFRTLISLIALFVITKCIGCRQISEMSLFDYVNGITMGSVAAELAISDKNFWGLLISLAVYGASAVAISWLADKSMVLRRFIEGKPLVLFENGTFLYKNMKKSKIDLCELLMICREQGYFDLSEVQCVVLESNGKISILPKSEYRPAMLSDLGIISERASLFANVIMEGKIMYDNLKHLGRDENWLKKQMSSQNISDVKEVFLAVSDKNDNCYFFQKHELAKPIDQLI